MAGYVRDFLSIEQALKAIIKDIKNEGFKEATGKSGLILENVVMLQMKIITYTIKIQ